jgi:hypothetical protein
MKRLSTRTPPIPDLLPAERKISRRQLIDQVARNEAPPAVRATPLRLPHEALEELSDLARAENISRNALICQLIDSGLRDFGRRTINELAPWFVDHLRRNRDGEA